MITYLLQKVVIFFLIFCNRLVNIFCKRLIYTKITEDIFQANAGFKGKGQDVRICDIQGKCNNFLNKNKKILHNMHFECIIMNYQKRFFLFK